MSVIIDGQRRLVAPEDPIIFHVDKSFHVFRFNFKLGVKMVETTDGLFDVAVMYNETQVFEHKFHLDIKYNFAIPNLPASLLIELSGGGIVNGHATVRLKLSGVLNLIVSKSFPILDQEISTAFLSAADVEQIRTAASGLVLPDTIRNVDQFIMIAVPASPTFATVASGLDQGGYSII